YIYWYMPLLAENTDGVEKRYKMQIYHKWRGLRLEITEYITQHRIPESNFRFLGIYEWKNIYDKVLERFVDEQYSRKHGLHWSNTNDGFQKSIG
ncbi:MAG: hypothetical protein K2N24_07980, partial [Lachnospiraceae bacterium]|nr:hypothetical protein [Lachnospiraceae bacterium]